MLFGQKDSEERPQWGAPLPPLLDEDGQPLSFPAPSPVHQGLSDTEIQFQHKALQAIYFYRNWGHTVATLDPLGLRRSAQEPSFSLPAFSQEELQKTLFIPEEWAGQSLGVVLGRLREKYTGTLTLEVAHLREGESSREWLQQLFEDPAAGESGLFPLGPDAQRELLSWLVKAEGFEKFLATKFPGSKRFGLEGADALLPAMALGLSKAWEVLGVQKTILGMAHRGRLNLMANLLKVPFDWFFERFQERVSPASGEQGDVKYHMGATQDTLVLLPNPSHLESINTVVMGWVRALQDQRGQEDARSVLGVVIHGDAAFMGQGVVAEGLGLARLAGYGTEGTVHIILNNQVGFTARPEETRSSAYASDLAKGFNVPVLHVNGDDVEAVLRGFWIALLYRHTFKADIVLDLWCYRRHGHNEVDEPTFTQPRMYAAIQKHPSLLESYGRLLKAQGVLEEEEILTLQKAYTAQLSEAFERVAAYSEGPAPALVSSDDTPKIPPETGVSLEIMAQIGEGIASVPQGFERHRKLDRFFDARLKMCRGMLPVDWSTAEALAFATLLQDGKNIRLSGQDSARGTFTQRHGVLVDQEKEAFYTPLNVLTPPRQIAFVNSPLSEMGVMGFELGYSVASPDTLVLWEAQFGDFVNGAQIIIDQYLAAGETKWGQRSGLVLLLPHGYEGQGPEHSSARPERFLQLAAQENLRIANCSTPANYFHLLRRQALNPEKKPLILMTPKSLLRHKLAVSPREALGLGTHFVPVLGETSLPRGPSSRVVLCTGKLYYDLLAKRMERALAVPLVRLEQLYPLCQEALVDALTPFVSPETHLVWAQEEAENQGAWRFVEPYLRHLSQRLGLKAWEYVGRPEAASPTTGYNTVHLQEQEALVEKALGIDNT